MEDNMITVGLIKMSEYLISDYIEYIMSEKEFYPFIIKIMNAYDNDLHISNSNLDDDIDVEVIIDDMGDLEVI